MKQLLPGLSNSVVTQSSATTLPRELTGTNFASPYRPWQYLAHSAASARPIAQQDMDNRLYVDLAAMCWGLEGVLAIFATHIYHLIESAYDYVAFIRASRVEVLEENKRLERVYVVFKEGSDSLASGGHYQEGFQDL